MRYRKTGFVSPLPRLALAAYWLIIGTMGLVSNMAANETGAVVGASAGLSDSSSGLWIRAFSLLDLALGLWTLSGLGLRFCYLAQMLVVAGYTLGLTILTPELWLDPFGRLAKNLPILALIWLSWRQEGERYDHPQNPSQ